MTMPLHTVEILRAACCLAGLDEKVTPEEQAHLERLAHEAGVGRVSLQAMIDRGRTDPNFFEKQFTILKVDPDKTMATLLDVAVADGRLDDAQRVVLQHFADTLGLPDERYRPMLDKAIARLKAGK